MKLAVFVSDYRMTVDTLERLKPEKMGVILVGNGVYHASVKEEGKTSSKLEEAKAKLGKAPITETEALDAINVWSDAEARNQYISDWHDSVVEKYLAAKTLAEEASAEPEAQNYTMIYLLVGIVVITAAAYFYIRSK